MPLVEAMGPPAGCPADHLPASARHAYDVRDVIAALVDGGRQLELAARWARNMVTTLVRLDGRPVGVIANQARYLGGTIDSAASEKGSWFVNLCDRLALPLVVLVDTPGFLPGANQERAGVIRHGSALLRAFARAAREVDRDAGQAYGGAHIVMNSRDLGADLTLAWPDAQIGAMAPCRRFRSPSAVRSSPARTGRSWRSCTPRGPSASISRQPAVMSMRSSRPGIRASV